MQLIPIKTSLLKPPKDDLFDVFDVSLPKVEEGDILLVSSKVVAIHEGNCVLESEYEKQDLAAKEADFLIPRDYWPTPLTVIYNAFIGTAGVDASNADGHYVLLPKDAFKSAEGIRQYLIERFKLKNVGVVITDSHSTPMRRGALGISIGYAGFSPTKNLVGENDLFGREFKIEVANIVDGLAAAANVVMGEGVERQPIVIARNVPDIEFTDNPDREFHMVPYKDDIFRVLYERFIGS